MKKLLLSLLLICSLGASAQFSGKGSGTADDPYQVTNAEQLFEIRNANSAYYKLMNDIDLTEWISKDNPEQGWLPISEFHGNLEGNHKYIKGLYINRPNTDNVGLFKYLTSNSNMDPKPEVKNLYIIEPHIVGNNNVGVIAGQGSSLFIKNVGIINPHVEGKDRIGGLVGNVSWLSESYNNVIIGGNILGEKFVGGMYGFATQYGGYGWNSTTSGFDRLYSSSQLHGIQYVGGIVGAAQSHYYVVTNQYSGAKTYYKIGGGITDCRYDGKITAQKVAGGILGYSFSETYCGQSAGIASDYINIKRNIFSGTIETEDSLCGMVGRYLNVSFGGRTYSERTENVCALDSIIVTGLTSKKPNRIADIEGENNYASLQTVVVHKKQTIDVTDDLFNGTAYSLNSLKKKNTYVGFGYDFDTTWSIVDGETLPYNFYQSAPVTITSFIGGANSVIKGTAMNDGRLFVIVNGKTVEGTVSKGIWEVKLGNVKVGTKASVSIVSTGMLPSVFATSIAEKDSSTPDIDPSSPDTDISTLENVVYIDEIEASAGTQLMLSVKMKNAVTASGFGFELYLPNGLTVATDEDGLPLVDLSTERTTARKTNQFVADLLGNGSLRVSASSTNGSAISGNDGEVCLVTVNIAKDMEDGDYPIALKNVTVTDMDAVVYNTDQVKTTLSISTYIPGETKTVTLPTNMTTLCVNKGLDFTNVAGLKAYVASSFDAETGTLRMMQVDKVPAGTALVLIGATGTYEVPCAKSAGVYVNLLKGVSENVTLPQTDGANTNYVLTNVKGFDRVDGDIQLTAGAAYLSLPGKLAKNTPVVTLHFENVADVNGDGVVDVEDVVAVVNIILNGGQ